MRTILNLLEFARASNMFFIEALTFQGIEKLFAGFVFKMLLKEDMISKELMENMRSWKHSGFSVHSGSPVKAEDEDSRKTLSEYISRAPFALDRMVFNENSDTVLYSGEHFHPNLGRNFDVSEPLEWIARITSHIPEKGAKQVIYYGAYSLAGNAARVSYRQQEPKRNLHLPVSIPHAPAAEGRCGLSF